MSRSAGTLLLALALALGLIAALDGGGAAWQLVALLAPVGLVALAGAHWAGRRRLGRLGGRFTLGIAIALGQLLVALLAGAGLMFLSGHDARLLVAILLFAALVAIRCAQVLANRTLRDVETVRDGLRAVERGDLTVRLPTDGRDEVAQLAAAANRMIAALAGERRSRDEAEAARRRLVAAVSHDLRTPMTSLQLLAEAIRDDVVDPASARRYAAAMSTHVRGLSALVDDLFELSRLDAGDFRWSMEQVRLDVLLAEAVAGMERDAARRGVAVRAQVPAGLRAPRGNPEQLQRVVLNLVQNAIRHTPPDGSVTVRAAPAAAGVEVEVADTGEGIPAADRARVFEPFFRGDAARTTDGSGLGMAIARAIVEAHGGRIWLADAARGTRVRFSLPAEH